MPESKKSQNFFESTKSLLVTSMSRSRNYNTCPDPSKDLAEAAQPFDCKMATVTRLSARTAMERDAYIRA